MTDIAERLVTLIETASNLSKKGAYREAAGHYLEAAQLAEKSFKNKRLKYLCEFRYLLELLTSESGQNRGFIQRIIQNLRDMKQDIDDDRLRTQVTPIIHYFEVLYLTVGDDIEALSKKIQTLRKQTDAPRDFFNSIAHVLADMMYVIECIRPYKRATEIPQREFEKRKQHLISCIRARKEHTAIPDLFQKILSEFELALFKAKNPDSVKRAISRFKQAIYNSDNQLLQIAVETMKPYLFEILNSSEKGDNIVSPAETEQKEIVEVKPGVFGITVNIKELGRRFWKRVCSRRKD